MIKLTDINKVLIEHHIYPNKRGYLYIRFILQNLSDEKSFRLKSYYDYAAENFHVKPNTIEKSISNAIESSFKFIDVAEKYGKMVDADKGKLTNKHFIGILFSMIHND